jgi:hypothetical protein
MNEEVFNVSVRKFLKKVGITSQREIEQAVRTAIADKRLKGNEALPAKIILTVEGLGLSLEVEGAIELE